VSLLYFQKAVIANAARIRELSLCFGKQRARMVLPGVEYLYSKTAITLTYGELLSYM
jgi:hypothetical protein